MPISSCNLWCKSILVICNDELYLSSSVSFDACAWFSVAWVFVPICFSVGLFLAMTCKTGSKEKWHYTIILKKLIFTFFTIDYPEAAIILKLLLLNFWAIQSEYEEAIAAIRAKVELTKNFVIKTRYIRNNMELPILTLQLWRKTK